MKKEQKLRDLSLHLISILVWFEMLWVTVLFIGSVFNWSGLTNQLEAVFFGSGFCGILALAALVALNIAANLNIISKTQAARVADASAMETGSASFIKTAGIAGLMIGIVILSLWIAEWRLYKTKQAEAENQIESIAEMKLIQDIVRLIHDNGKAAELEKMREAASENINAGARLSIIFPEQVQDAAIYREFTAWCCGTENENKTIADADLPKFVPKAAEKKQFDQLAAGKIVKFTVPDGGSLRTFRLMRTDAGKIILLLDTSRRLEYKRGSF